MTRPPLPPFDIETAHQKVRAAENAWNTRDPEASPPPIPRILCGETATSSLPGAQKSSPS